MAVAVTHCNELCPSRIKAIPATHKSFVVSTRWPGSYDRNATRRTDTAGPENKPDQSWTVEQLAIYAKGKVASSAHAEKEAILQAHKSAVALFWAGAALWLIRDKLKKEERWVAWQKANKLARSTVLEAVALYE